MYWFRWVTDGACFLACVDRLPGASGGGGAQLSIGVLEGPIVNPSFSIRNVVAVDNSAGGEHF